LRQKTESVFGKKNVALYPVTRGDKKERGRRKARKWSSSKEREGEKKERP